MIDYETVPLYWIGPPLPDDIEKCEACIRVDLGMSMGDSLEEPSDLFFHRVPLTDKRFDGPLVFIKPYKDGFGLIYDEDPKWEEWDDEET